MATNPNFPPPLGDYDLTELTDYELPRIRVEYITIKGEVYTRSYPFPPRMNLYQFAQMAKDIARQLIATHNKVIRAL